MSIDKKLVDKKEKELEQETYESSSYYGIEEERPAKKIVPPEEKTARSLRQRKYKEESMARFSNIYMIAGIIIGIAVFYFLVVPDIKKDYKEQIRELETSYNQTISTKNNQIENLNMEVESLSAKNSDYESAQAGMQNTIDNLTTEVETLKRAVESGGLAIPAEASSDEGGDTEETTAPDGEEAETAKPDEEAAKEAAKNAAAERNNANVIGISGDSIESIISNE